MENTLCSHIEAIKKIKLAKENVCVECIKQGTDWVHLRTCQTCGVTLCCDSSPEQHMSQHTLDTAHPVIISAEKGENWIYCYPDDKIGDYRIGEHGEIYL